MTNAAAIPVANCPAMLVGCSLQKDGHKITLIVPPDAIPRLLLEAHMGTKFMAAFALYTEDEKAPQVSRQAAGTNERSGSSETAAGAGARERYAGASKGERAVMDAGILCADSQFQLWCVGPGGAEEEAIAFVHAICGVTSRKQFKTDEEAAAKFYDIKYDFDQATGRAAKDVRS